MAWLLPFTSIQQSCPTWGPRPSVGADGVGGQIDRVEKADLSQLSPLGSSLSFLIIAFVLGPEQQEALPGAWPVHPIENASTKNLNLSNTEARWGTQILLWKKCGRPHGVVTDERKWICRERKGVGAEPSGPCGYSHNSRWRLQGRWTTVSSWNQKGCVQTEILCAPLSVITSMRSSSALSLHPYVSPVPSSVHSIFIPFHLPPYLLSPTSVTSLPQHPGPEGIPEVCPDFLKECWTPSEAAKHQALSPYPLLSTAFPESWRKEGREGGRGRRPADWIWSAGPCGTKEGSRNSLAGSYPWKEMKERVVGRNGINSLSLSQSMDLWHGWDDLRALEW